MFFSKDDDEDDFMSPGGSKLGALFGMDKPGAPGDNSSLTYTAPKQPKKKEPSPPNKGASPAVAFAVAVHAYKYVDNKYASQGKLGCAILASHAASEYSILMYVSQSQKVSTAKITSAFVYTVQPNKYANFYDDLRQSWSILFDSDQNAIDFAKHVCLAKALSSGPIPTSLVSQDLSGGEGGALESGDSVEVKYTGWLLTNNTFGQVFDSNVSADKLFRFKLGAGKVIKGWDTGVVGMKKGGKRFLVVPPGMAYGSQGMGNKVPANSTLLFEVEVVRVKLVGRESSPSPAQTPPQPVQAPPTGDMEDDEVDEHTVKGRTKSITEQLSHSPTQDTSKARLISRMAKMGKPMLPLSGAVVASPDSDHEEPVPESPVPVGSQPVQQEAKVHKPVPTAAPVQPQAIPVQSQQPAFTAVQSQAPAQPAFLQNLPVSQQMALYQPQQQQNFLQQQANMMQQAGFQQQQQMYGGGIGNQPQQAVPGTSLPPYVIPGMPQGTDMMLLSETRQQNTEVRLTLSKMSDKVDQVLQKVEHPHGAQSSLLPNMETSVLLHNITRIVQENERLKKDVFDKSAKIESLNEKISGLLQQNQSFVEKSQVLMEQRNEGLLSSANQTTNRVLSLEQEKVGLTQQLSEATSQISALQLEVSGLKKKEFELSQQIESSGKSSRRQNEELETLKTQHSEDEGRISELSRQLREEKQSRKAVESNMSQIQEEMSDLQAAKSALEKNLSERKRKAAEERRQLEDELEDVKTNLEADIQSLKDKLRKQKTSASAASQEQISQIEEELQRDWQEKSDKLLSLAAEKHARALKTVQEEKEELETKVEELEKKVQTMRQSTSGNDQKVADLEEQLNQMTTWKDKYEKLRGQATSMKEQYEEQIEELEEQQEKLQQQLQTVRSEVKTGGGAAGGGQGLLDEVKKIMNTVYKEMKETFEADDSYSGSQILQAILNSIKSTTLSLMQRMKSAEEGKESEEEEEEESEEEEEEEESEEEDEDEQEGEQKEVEQSSQSSLKTEPPPVIARETDENVEPKTDTIDPADSKTIVNTPSAIDKSDNINKNVEEDISEANVEENKAASDKGIEQPSEQSDKETNGVVETVPDVKEEKEAEEEVTSSSSMKAGSLEDLLDSALESKPKPPEPVTTPIMSTEPPPMSDQESDEEEEEQTKNRTKSIFADDDDDDDDNVANTLGISNKPVMNGEPVKSGAEKQMVNDEDLKPKPPPPLFGDDDDDDDLDWLG